MVRGPSNGFSRLPVGMASVVEEPLTLADLAVNLKHSFS